MTTKALREYPVEWLTCRGLNDYDAPAELPDDMATAALNIDLVRGAIAKRRNGSTLKTFTGDTFSGYAQLARFSPGQSDAAAELHIVSNDSKILRVAAGSAAANLSLTDAISSLPQNAHHAVLNGKLYWAYDSTVNRLHVYDPRSTTTVRRAGLIAPAAPTAANGGGAGVAVIRYYRIQWRVLVGSDTVRVSNLGPAVSFTPTANGVTVTKPAASSPTEGETHWVVYGSADDDLYYRISAPIVVATTTFLDNFTPSAYADVFDDAAPSEGANTPFPSVKYLFSAGDRLVGFGAWETAAGASLTPYAGRVWFTPVLGSSDDPEVEDDERVSNTDDQKGYIDLQRNVGAEDRAIAGHVDGQILVFFSRGIWLLTPTGNATIPYRKNQLSSVLGAVGQWSTFSGEDENGAPCVYFLDPTRGPYRYGRSGFQWLGYDVQTAWSTVNLGAANRVAVGVYDTATRRAIFCLAISSNDDPTIALVFHVSETQITRDGIRYGWVKWDGLVAAARCMVLFAETFGATMSIRMKPYVGNYTTGGAIVTLIKTNDSTVSTADDTTRYQSTVTSKAWDLAPQTVYKGLGKAYMQGLAAGTGPLAVPPDIRLSVARNYGDITGQNDTVNTTPFGSESRVFKHFSKFNMAGAWTFQATIADTAFSASNQPWTVDRVIINVETTSDEVGNGIPA